MFDICKYNIYIFIFDKEINLIIIVVEVSFYG